MKNRLTSEEIKSVEIGILDIVDGFCKQNRYQYFLGYGSCLGAVRHKGFIPWDDDIDIIMPRPDYDNFIKNFHDKNERYKVATYLEGKDYWQSFSKVVDTRTILKEREAVGYSGGGGYIDVFPIDGFGSAYSPAIAHFNRLKKTLRRGYSYIYNKQDSFKDRTSMALYLYQHFFTFDTVMRFENKMAHKCPYESSELVGVWTSPYESQKEIFHKEVFSDFELLEFEGNHYPVPCMYDAYLTQLYGDYMKLPPECERASHHSFDLYWK